MKIRNLLFAFSLLVGVIDSAYGAHAEGFFDLDEVLAALQAEDSFLETEEDVTDAVGEFMNLVEQEQRNNDLFRSIRARDRVGVQALMRQGADITARNEHGLIPLHDMFLFYSAPAPEIVAALLEANPASVNVQDAIGRTALAMAIVDFNVTNTPEQTKREVKMLINAGTDLTLTDSREKTPLHLAVEITRYDISDIVSDLIGRAPEVINRTDSEGRTPLHSAIANYNRPAITLLVDARANMDIPDNQGLTPRELATDRGLGHLLRPRGVGTKPAAALQKKQ